MTTVLRFWDKRGKKKENGVLQLSSEFYTVKLSTHSTESEGKKNPKHLRLSLEITHIETNHNLIWEQSSFRGELRQIQNHYFETKSS